MKFSRVFYAAIGIGIIFGVCLMMFEHGIFGDASMRDMIGSVFILGSIAVGAFVMLRYKLDPEWNTDLFVSTPIKDWWEEHICGPVNPDYDDECFMCNEGTCEGCPILEKEVFIDGERDEG